MRSRTFLVSALGGAVASAVAILALAGAQPPDLDPAFVALVYARHLATRGVFSWNAAEPATSGYGSLLDVLLKAGLVRVSPSDPVRDAQLLTIAFVVASAFVGALFAARATRDAVRLPMALGLLGALAFGANLALVQGAAFLLETPLHATLALASLGLLLFGPHERASVRVGLAILWLLLVLVRPEGLPLAVLHAGLFVAFASARLSRRAALAPAIALGAFVVAYVAWHVVTFGRLAPPPMRPGADLVDRLAAGVSYALSFVSAPTRGLAHVLVVVGVVLAVATWVKGLAQRRVAAAALSSLVAFTSVVFEGGDVYLGGRFLAVPIALAIAAAVLAVGALEGRPRVVLAIILSLFCIETLSRVAPSPGVRLARIARWPITNERFRCEKQAIDAIASRATTFAVTDMARAKFYDDELRVDVRAGEYRIADAVASDDEVVQIGLRAMSSKPMAAASTEEITENDRVATSVFGSPFDRATKKALVARYRPVSIPTCVFFYNVFVRDDVAARFEDGDILVGRAKQFE